MRMYLGIPSIWYQKREMLLLLASTPLTRTCIARPHMSLLGGLYGLLSASDDVDDDSKAQDSRNLRPLSFWSVR